MSLFKYHLIILLVLVNALVPLKPAVVTGYWQNWSPSIRLIDVPTTYDIVAVAFALQGSPSGAVSFVLDSSQVQSTFIADIKALNQRGQAVVLSVGGATGTINLQSSLDADAFATSCRQIMLQYGFDGIDIDIENYFNKPDLIVAALRKLAAIYGPYRLLMAPQTVNVQANTYNYANYMTIIDQTKDLITIVNTQYYNTGSMIGQDGALVDISKDPVSFIVSLADVLIAGGHLKPSQVGLGFLLTAEGSGQVSTVIMTRAWNCLSKSTQYCTTYKPKTTSFASYPYTLLGGVMSWSINADAKSNNAFIKAIAPIVHGSIGAAPVIPPTTAGTCGSGRIGDGKCANGQCCSKWGYCGTTVAYCEQSCGSGKIGNGKCNIPGQCCSKWGYCGTATAYCDQSCGAGKIGNGKCTNGQCCSSRGYCGASVTYCAK